MTAIALFSDTPGSTTPQTPADAPPAVAEGDAGVLVPTWLVALVIVLLMGVTAVTVLIVREISARPADLSADQLELSDLESAAKADPGDIQTGLLLGFAYQEADRFDEALAAFERVLAQEPYQREALYGLGIASLATGQTRQAEEALLVVLAQEPGHVQAAHALGDHYLTTGRFEELLAVVEPAAESSIGLSDLCYLMGYAHEQLGNREEAEECYRNALLYVPDDSAARDGLWRLGVSR